MVPNRKRIVLIGNPNVGKSVIFSRLTGVHVIASNYPGTTVSYTRGPFTFPSGITSPLPENFLVGETIDIVDTPGTYTLQFTSRAEEVAAEILESGDILINAVDATNLERNLYLTLQLLEKNSPTIVALNFWDETKHLGIKIDPEKLEELLGVPVVTTVGVTGEGIRHLVERLCEAKPGNHPRRSNEERWQKIGTIISQCQALTHHHHTFLQRLSDISVQPLTGGIMAAVVIPAAFLIIRFIGEEIITYAAEPLFEKLYLPLLYHLSGFLGPGSFLHDILVGELIGGRIDFLRSFGVLTTGLFVPLAMVLPYVFSFYLVLSFLEDFGYLPRLAVLLDNLLHRVGLHGYAIIPILLGLGCNVPAILATRILESRRERFIAATLISIGVPCAALQAMIFGLVGARGGQYVLVVYLTLFLTWMLLGLILNRFTAGYSPELIIEIPRYHLPALGPFLKKVGARISGFTREALPVILAGVLAINLLCAVGAFDFLAELTSPVLKYLLGLPKESIAALLIGFLRKDMAVAMLGGLDLTIKQLVVACTVLAMFFPCIVTFSVLFKELGVKDMLKASAIMFIVSLAVGTILNLIIRF